MKQGLCEIAIYLFKIAKPLLPSISFNTSSTLPKLPRTNANSSNTMSSPGSGEPHRLNQKHRWLSYKQITVKYE